MKHTFLFDIDAIYIVLFLFFAMLITLIVGYKLGVKSKKISSDDSGILASLLGLFALLIAFTFGMAGSRFENRKANLIEESNCIGTAILRSDIYPDSVKTAFRQDFEKYLDARILYFKSDRDDTTIYVSLKNSTEAAEDLWKRASFYAKNKDYFLQSQLMMPALNSMFDITSTTDAVFNSSVPETIIYLLLSFSIIISFYIGFSSGFKKQIDKVFLFGFCFLTSIVIYTILDLDRPRRGVINLKKEIVLLEDLKVYFK
jgi:hypothetical protein